MRRPRLLHILLGLAAAMLPMAIACSGDDDDEGGTGAAPASAATAPPVTGGGVAPQEAAKVSPALAIEGIDHALNQQVDMSLTVTSPVFHATRRIPKKHTCTRMSNNEPNISPSFGWEAVPDGAASIAVIMDSMQAPGDTPWIHWVIWNIPPDLTELPEGSPSEELLSRGVRQGVNEGGAIGYVGPCPPALIVTNGATGDVRRTTTIEDVKRYYFTVYALDTTLDLQEGATKQQLLDAIDGHVLTAGRLEGERHGDIIRRNQ